MDDIDENIPIYIGFSALGFSLFYRIPQIYKLWKNKSSNDISVWMIHLQTISYLLYIAYGILRKDLVYIISSGISIFQNLILYFLYCLYKEKGEKDEISFSV